MRTGDEVRVSTPVNTASSRSKPRICLPNAGNASRIASIAYGGQRLGQIAQQHARLVRRLDLAECSRGDTANEIPHQLSRRAIVAAAQL